MQHVILNTKDILFFRLFVTKYSSLLNNNFKMSGFYFYAYTEPNKLNLPNALPTQRPYLTVWGPHSATNNGYLE